MPRVAVAVAVWISLHAWLIHGNGLCIFPSHRKKQDKIQPLLQSTLRLSKETRQNPATAPINVKIIHSFWLLKGFVIRENRKNLRIDWEKMYAIDLKLESN